MGQTHTQKYMKPLLERVLNDEVDPSSIITHRVDIEQGPDAYKTFSAEKDKCMKVIIEMH